MNDFLHRAGLPAHGPLAALLLALAVNAPAMAQGNGAASATGVGTADSARTAVAQTDAPAQIAPSPSPARVRASHRVEVIGPGEHVETVIDRMRSRGATSVTTAPAERPPVRGPDLRAPEHGGQGPARGPGRGSSGPPGGPPSNGPPPERR